jgi:hypothetical protein
VDHPESENAWPADPLVDASGQDAGDAGEESLGAGECEATAVSGATSDVPDASREDERPGDDASDAADDTGDAGERGGVEGKGAEAT